MSRLPGLEPAADPSTCIRLTVDGTEVDAVHGESVLGVLLAEGRRAICRSDRDRVFGAYCGMGVCFACCVTIDDVPRRRACQTTAVAGMRVETLTVGFDRGGRHDRSVAG